MRPLRLVVEGFTAFRDRTEIDFEGADLFALVGPTGSGKSSVIDAITFALYGQVARYDNAKLVGPVITQGAVGATIDFSFAIGGDEYRVHRQVVRTKTGGSTKEVRLERGDETLAGTAREADAALAELLGLTFDQFTTCVVLPQGAFARFLHEKPKERRSLLVQLLDLGAYAAMASRANTEASDAASKVEVFERQLQELSGLLDVDRKALAERIERLDAVENDLLGAAPRLAELDREITAVRAGADAASGAAAELAKVQVPDEVRERAVLLDEATKAVRDARLHEQSAEAQLTTAEEARRALPERAELDRARDRHQRRARLAERLDEGEAVTAKARTSEADADASLQAAELEVRRTAAAFEGARRDHAAHDLAAGLSEGDPCPVCHRPVDEPPSHDLADLHALERVRDGAVQRLDEVRRTRGEASQQRARYEEQLRSLRDQLGEVERELEGTSSSEELDELEARIARADEAVAAARVALEARRDQVKRAESKQRKVESLAKIDADEYAELRESLAVLGPPRAERERLLDDWESLAAWASERRPQLERDAVAAREKAEGLERERVEVDETLAASLRDVGLDRSDDPLDAVGGARRAAEKELDRVEAAHERAAGLSAERDELTSRAEVGRLLGRLLRSDGFQQWLLDEAIGALVEGATGRLLSLSRGQYSLAVDDKGEFLVVDHFNADEVRIARTLSGGETFLASLALALALADQIADLAAEGAPRLESIFLDEGFGTLDPETLDVVIDAIESLGATGRVVGLVSHVRDLAERVPVRFAVQKGPATATVERIDQ